jgi:hypothetical protein
MCPVGLCALRALGIKKDLGGLAMQLGSRVSAVPMPEQLRHARHVARRHHESMQDRYLQCNTDLVDHS